MKNTQVSNYQPLDYGGSLLNNVIQILLKTQFSIVFNMYNINWKNITNISNDEILFPSVPMFNIKVEKICNIQIKHSHPIITLMSPKKTILIKHFMTIIFWTY
jgi:hypothetical protein